MKKAVMPLVWLRDYKTPTGATSKILVTSIGAATDLQSEDLRRLFVNSAYFLTGLEVPKAADVSTVGEYTPTKFGFKGYKKGVKVESHELRLAARGFPSPSTKAVPQPGRPSAFHTLPL